MITVIIPTRNRNDLLIKSLEAILANKIDFNKILIIDSSDNINFKNVEYLHHKIKHYRTKIQSAARQRNIGIEKLDPNEKYIAFLDDDVLVPNNYFANLINTLVKTDCVGVSGLALNPMVSIKNNPVRRIQNIIAKIFLLYSSKEGVVLKSGVNIPVNQNRRSLMEVEWLIGCSIWDFSKLNGLKFREDFQGQSLGEDVIYSHNARKFGKIYVDPRIILTHFESPIMRPNEEEFMYMWVRNRYEIMKEINTEVGSLTPYHWANFGKMLQILFLKNKGKMKALKGMFRAYNEILTN
jgi:glycosyltransferase involved in cell wall biosynthesis